MSMIRRILPGLFCSLLAVAPAAANAGDAAKGKALFMTDCSACHRADGAGGVKFRHGVSADLRAPGLEKTYNHSDELLLRAVLQAKDQNGQRLDAPMPAWAGRLNMPEAQDIIAYLKTLHS